MSRLPVNLTEGFEARRKLLHPSRATLRDLYPSPQAARDQSSRIALVSTFVLLILGWAIILYWRIQ